MFSPCTFFHVKSSSEVWDADTYRELERAKYYGCKLFMCARQKQPYKFASLRDSARYPLYITSRKRRINYWLK